MTKPLPSSRHAYTNKDGTPTKDFYNYLRSLTGATTVVVSGGGSVRTQRSITSSGALPILGSDQILNINSGSDLSPVVPLASGRAGVPLTFKNLPGSHVQTITRTSPDTFDGQATYLLAPGATLTLVPYGDGVNTGYAIE